MIDDSSTKLSYDAELTSLQPTAVPAGSAEIFVNWSDLAVNAMGRSFNPNGIDQVIVAKYGLTPSELEAAVPQSSKTIADQMYRGEVDSGTSIDLSTLESDAGQSFPGSTPAAPGSWRSSADAA